MPNVDRHGEPQFFKSLFVSSSAFIIWGCVGESWWARWHLHKTVFSPQTFTGWLKKNQTINCRSKCAKTIVLWNPAHALARVAGLEIRTNIPTITKSMCVERAEFIGKPCNLNNHGAPPHSDDVSDMLETLFAGKTVSRKRPVTSGDYTWGPVAKEYMFRKMCLQNCWHWWMLCSNEAHRVDHWPLTVDDMMRIDNMMMTMINFHMPMRKVST